MKQPKINALLSAMNSKRTGYRAGWVEGRCPLAPWRHTGGVDSHPSFAIKESNQKKSICKCLSCGFGGDLMDLLFRVNDLQKRHGAQPGYDLKVASALITNEFDDLELDLSTIPEYGAPPEKVELPFPESWLASFKFIAQFPDALAYLHSRGVSTAMSKELDIRYDPIQRRIGFPFRNFKGELMGIHGRSLDANPELRYYQYGYKSHRNLHAWMGENTIDFDKPVVVVEGPFDFTSVYRVYKNVAASFTSGLSIAKVKRLADADQIITFYDYGSGGEAARSRIKSVLKKSMVTHLIPTKEQDDAGAMSVSEVSSYLKGLVPLSQ